MAATNKERTVVFITGANDGIGYETVKMLVQSDRSYHVFLGSRLVDKGQAAADVLRKQFPDSASKIDVTQVDVTSDDQIHTAFQDVEQGPGHIDVLINNAGVSIENKVPRGELTMRDAWNQMFDVNVTGAHIVTQTFAPLLLKSRDPRLIFLASGLSQLETMSKSHYPGPPSAAGWPKQSGMSPDAYRTTKTALNMMMLIWYWSLKEDGVKVWAINPGWLATNLMGPKEVLRERGAKDPAEGGELIKQVVEGQRDDDVGKVLLRDGVQPF